MPWALGQTPGGSSRETLSTGNKGTEGRHVEALEAPLCKGPVQGFAWTPGPASQVTLWRAPACGLCPLTHKCVCATGLMQPLTRLGRWCGWQTGALGRERKPNCVWFLTWGPSTGGAGRHPQKHDSSVPATEDRWPRLCAGCCPARGQRLVRSEHLLVQPPLREDGRGMQGGGWGHRGGQKRDLAPALLCPHPATWA